MVQSAGIHQYMDPPLRHWLVVYSLWFVPEVSEAGEIDTGVTERNVKSW